MVTSEIEEMIRMSEELDMDVIRENQAPTFSEYVLTLLEEKSIRRSQLIIDLNLDRNYGYQILNGTRLPMRSQILHIGLAILYGKTIETKKPPIKENAKYRVEFVFGLTK